MLPPYNGVFIGVSKLANQPEMGVLVSARIPGTLRETDEAYGAYQTGMILFTMSRHCMVAELIR